ncbi:MAG: thioredoxin family protein [Crocinitomicaceae bacterium]|nr:thioredoxin family protein [Crocinitomicaceae bacterium]MDC1384973.1 thioredoxin family protein [Crocinitomicaceae bacterium]
MKIILLTFIAFTLNFNGFPQESDEVTGIQFVNGTWEEVVAIAKKEKKPIFVDAFTTWCGPCKWMAKTTFKDSAVGTFMTENFISYKMDMEKGEGVEFAKKNEVRVYPTLLYFDSKGDFIHRAAGALKAEAFIETGRTALNPKERFVTFQRKFERGDSDKEFLLNFITKSQEASVPAEKPFNKYWALLSEDEKISEANLILMQTITSGFSNMDHELFLFMNTNRAKYIKKLGTEKFEPFWNQAYNSAVWYAAKEKKGSDSKAKMKKVKAIFTGKKNEVDAFYDMNVAWQSRDDDKIKKAAAVYAEVTTDWQFLNGEAWAVYEKSDSKEELEKALIWIRKSVEFNSNYMNLDTKGSILYKLKHYEKAIDALEEAIEKADETVPAASLNITETLLREIIMEMQETDD